MPDFVPDDFDEYIEHSNTVENILGALTDDDVTATALAMEPTLYNCADALAATGLSRVDALVATHGFVARYLTHWYSPGDEEND